MDEFRTRPRSPITLVALLSALLVLAMAAFIARNAEPPRSPSSMNIKSARLPPRAIFPEDLAWWWPQHVGPTAFMYQCQARGAEAHLSKSIVVWTDSAYRVKALGPAMEEVPLPTYATEMLADHTAATGHTIHLPGSVHVIVNTTTTSHTGSMQVGTQALDCTRTWDD